MSEVITQAVILIIDARTMCVVAYLYTGCPNWLRTSVVNFVVIPLKETLWSVSTLFLLSTCFAETRESSDRIFPKSVYLRLSINLITFVDIAQIKVKKL